MKLFSPRWQVRLQLDNVINGGQLAFLGFSAFAKVLLLGYITSSYTNLDQNSASYSNLGQNLASESGQTSASRSEHQLFSFWVSKWRVLGMPANCYLNMQDVLLPGCKCKCLCLCNVHVGLVHPWCRLEYFLFINKRPASNIQPHGKTDTAEMQEHQRNNAQRALNAHVWYHWLSTNNTRKPMASTTEVRNYLIFK